MIIIHVKYYDLSNNIRVDNMIFVKVKKKQVNFTVLEDFRSRNNEKSNSFKYNFNYLLNTYRIINNHLKLIESKLSY